MQLQFLSHSCIKLIHADVCLLIDPFLTHNPIAPVTWQEAARGVTHIVLTHGHGDHVGDTPAIAKANNIPVVAMVELARWLEKQGVEKTVQVNFGTSELQDTKTPVSISLVPAWHTSTANDGTYLGNPAGLVITMGGHTVYHAGDTGLFGDMALINEYYQPDVVLLPIGGGYTMDAKTAAFAANKYFAGAKHIIPLHYATFPALAPNATEFQSLCKNLAVNAMKPAETLTL